jgi:hypothetical protein
MSITFTDQDKLTLRTAAYGAVTLLAAADAASSPHKVATDGSIALACATGPGRARARRERRPPYDRRLAATGPRSGRTFASSRPPACPAPVPEPEPERGQ